MRPLTNLKLTLVAYLFNWVDFTIHDWPPDKKRRWVKQLASFVYWFPSSQKTTMRENLKKFLNLSGPALKKTNKEIFKNFGTTLLDFFFPDDLHVSFPNKSKLDAVRSQHGGVLLLTFHMGNWELGGITLGKMGYPVTAIYQPYENKKFRRLIEQKRGDSINLIPVGDNAANHVLRALKKGDVVAMLGDHPFGEDGIEVECMGKKIKWPKGPVLLAVRQKAPVVIAVVLQDKQGHYTIHTEDPIFPTGISSKHINDIVQQTVHTFSTYLKAYPTQWYRFQSFN